MICGYSSGTNEFSHGNSTALCLLVTALWQGRICADRFYHSLGWCEACAHMCASASRSSGLCFTRYKIIRHRQAIFESNGDKLSSTAEYWIRSWEVSDTDSPADWMPTHKPTELSTIKLKNFNSTALPYMSEHSAHLTSLPLTHTYMCVCVCVYVYMGYMFTAMWQQTD